MITLPPACPYCGNRNWFPGPKGGVSQNVLCLTEECRHWFNWTAVIDDLQDLNRVEPIEVFKAFEQHKLSGDYRITPEQAWTLQYEMQNHGYLLIWTVTHNTKDYGDKWIARLSTLKGGDSETLRYVMIADTLEKLREGLPPGLTCLPRQDADEPVIVEVWM